MLLVPLLFVALLAPAAATKPSSKAPATKPSPTTKPTATATTKPGRTGVVKGEKPQVPKYLPATPKEHAKAIEDAREDAKKTAEKLDIKLAEIQTAHFIVFTDWDPAEYDFLKTNLEGAYTCVSKQFEMSPKDNIFVGKLPVFMFARRDIFFRYAREIDGSNLPAAVAGYYRTTGNGFGHMAMWKPEVKANAQDTSYAELEWAYVLTHEFTHAFIARYRTNEHVPRWLNEGTAEIIATSQFPSPDRRALAKKMANSRGIDFMPLFNDGQMPGGEMYPVMMTMVESLVHEDRQAFLGFFDDIKAGMDPKESLMKRYDLDYEQLIDFWKMYVRQNI